MKKINWLLFTFFALTVFACKDDEDPVELDSTAPSITITSPTEGQTFNPGGVVPLQARVEDNDALQEVVITVTGPGGASNTFTRGTSDFTDNGRVDELDLPIQLPADAAPGTYTLTIDASDAQGNDANTASVGIVVEEGASETAVTFILTDIPENTPEDEDIYIAGEFAAGTWEAPEDGQGNEDLRFTRQDDGTYTVTVEPSEEAINNGRIEYKILRQGGWATEEATADCEIPSNRVHTIGETDDVVEIEIAAWADLCGTGEQEGSIDATGFDDGFNTLGAMDDEGNAVGTPVNFNFTGAEGIDSVNVSARTVDGTETLNRGFNQAWFDEQGIDNTGDFTFTDELVFPNVTSAEGATNLTVTTFRGGQQLATRNFDTSVGAAPGARRVNLNVTGPEDLPEGSRVFASGNFQPVRYAVNDPNYELTRNAETGQFQTSLYTTGDLNYSYSVLHEDGTTTFEADDNCVEAQQGTGTRNYVFNDTDVDVDDVEETVNFTGFGACP